MALAGDPARQTWAHLSYRDGPGVSNQGEALSYGGFIETGQLQYQQPRTLSAHQSPVIQRSIHASDELAGGSSHVLESQPRINYSLLHAHVVPTSIRKQKKGRGGRQPGSHLPADDAANARSVRGVGSCWRCSFQKTKCSTHMTCSTCSAIVNFRTWPLGCERRSIKDMLRNSLVPGE
ncbi:hypothetical protein ASPZODRAFT_680183 [Penicilliopsis zonata CBS 506.65]|uniref:Uncharacterized protein n=1 Tax=Penicilliopsis zonata CBS 506.65 TaxID=1073090 RepID=A0A1L9SBE9_9EURO|nr:hypothetical protein ASPZODRAFT_680183 [Penicilliopsis zonata CBS 506.65]OJJ44505.1 hypothetical protein ASPZODRAFT_680183 [Penicilliopsis zonata CBS 506.65]